MGEKFYVTDTDLSARFPIYTRGNVGEVFPDPVTPLTSGTTLWFAELGWQDTWIRIGAFEPEEFPEGTFSQLGVLGGYCYLNASLVRVFGERGPGLSWEIMDNAVFGVQPGVPPYAEMPGDVQPAATERMGATFGYVLSQSRIEDLTELMDDRATTVELRRNRPDLSTLTDTELIERYMGLAAAHRHLFAHHIYVTFLAGG